jgi:hypothetical protein
MLTAAASNSTEVAEDLLSYFVHIGNKECYAAMLYICFDLLRPDVVEELSWRHGLNDFLMPYKIQVQRSTTDKVCFALAANTETLHAETPVAPHLGKGGQGASKERFPKGAAGRGGTHH